MNTGSVCVYTILPSAQFLHSWQKQRRSNQSDLLRASRGMPGKSTTRGRPALISFLYRTAVLLGIGLRDTSCKFSLPSVHETPLLAAKLYTLVCFKIITGFLQFHTCHFRILVSLVCVTLNSLKCVTAFITFICLLALTEFYIFKSAYGVVRWQLLPGVALYHLPYCTSYRARWHSGYSPNFYAAGIGHVSQ
jgi:hypothetical protein